MIPENDIFLPPLSLFAAIELMLTMAEKVYGKEQVKLTASGTIASLAFDVTANAHELRTNSTVVELLDRAREANWLQARRCALTHQPTNGSLVYTLEANLSGRLHVDNVVKTHALKVLQVLNERMRSDGSPMSTLDDYPPLVKGVMQGEIQALGDLRSINATLSSHVANIIQRHDEYLVKKAGDLDKDFNARVGARETQLDTREQSIVEREAAHKKEVEEFDTRRTTVVRRDITKQLGLKLDARSKITLSKETGRKRFPIHIVFIVAIAALAACAVGPYLSLLEAPSDNQPDWRMFLAPAAALIGFVSMVIWYIRWNDSWFAQHARTEFATQKMGVDVLRAQWLAELVLELKAQGYELPDSLILSFGAGLFGPVDWKAAEHPIENLTDLVRSLSRVRVEPGVVELERAVKAKK